MSSVSIRVSKLTKVFKSGKVGLHECSFEIESHTLTAILGPSGCGKSTLLKALIGDSPKTSGKIHIEGVELNEENYDLIKTHIGYVPQDDIVHRDLTVEQCLTFSAHLRLSDLPFKEQQKRVEEVIDELKLGQLKNQLISEISGGQRKRVAIGVEILTKPKVLFLDEPTSPLDPQTIEEFLKILQNLARNGTTVLMVTHKPEDLGYMDDCVFMGVGGFITYKGKPSEIVSYFQKENIVQVYADMDKPNVIEKFASAFSSKTPQFSILESNKGNLNPRRHTNYFSQTVWLTLRYLSRKLNDLESLGIQLSQSPIIALLVIMIFKQLDQVVLFFIVISAVWFGTNNAAKEIVSERSIFKREHMYNQGIIPYLISKILVLSLVGLAQSAIFVTIISQNYKNTIVPMENPIQITIWMFGLIVVSSLFGLTLSAFSSSVEKVMGLIPIALIPQIMLSGIMVQMTAIYVKAPSFLIISRWAMTGISRIQTNVYSNIKQKSTSSLGLLKENLGETYNYFNNSTFEGYILVLQSFFFFILIYLILKDRH